MHVIFGMENKAYRIFVIGMFGIPSHIIRFIRNLKLINPLVEITLFSDRPYSAFSQEIAEFIEEYIQWNRRPKLLARLARFKSFNDAIDCLSIALQMRRISKNRQYDIVNIHYPQYFMSYVMSRLKKMSSSIVVTPWGSDVLRLEGKRKRRLLAKVFQRANYITTDPSGNIGKALVNEMGVDKNKLHFLLWGSETVDYINEHIDEVTTEEAKSHLSLNDRYVITCGYNAFEEQRHEVIVWAIKTIERQLPDNLTLLFPVTYGYSYGTRKNEYVARLKLLCKDLELDAVFYENYLSVDELFYLRMGTDMFVHIQTTDAGNSSLQEYILCGKKVVHGAWIHYPYLENHEPLCYFPVASLDDLGDAILKAYHSGAIKTPDKVIDYIRNQGWRARMKLWDDFFCSLTHGTK